VLREGRAPGRPPLVAPLDMSRVQGRYEWG